MTLRKFKKIDIADAFFDSLKEDYAGFEGWFNRKKNEKAYILEQKGELQGFLYLKREQGPVKDVTRCFSHK